MSVRLIQFYIVQVFFIMVSEGRLHLCYNLYVDVKEVFIMRKLISLCVAFFCIFAFTACGGSQTQPEEAEKYDADVSFVDNVHPEDYMDEDRDAVETLCDDCLEAMKDVTSDREYNRVKNKFEKDLSKYDSTGDLVDYYKSALDGYVGNFEDGKIDKAGIYELYEKKEEQLYAAEDKKDFYDICVAIDKSIEDSFDVSIAPSTDVRLYMEDRNMNDGKLFDGKPSSSRNSDNDSIWPENGAYVDYEGNSYATREEVQEAVNSGKASGYYYLYPDGRVDSSVPVSDEILDKYKAKHGGNVNDEE